MKKVLVSGYIGFNNFGDEAIFYALSKHLKTLGFDISVLCNNCQNVKKTYDVKALRFKNPFDILKGIINCDVLISGGGSLLQNKTSNFSLYYYLFIIFLAKVFLKKVFIFSQGIEPIIGKKQENLTKKILKMVDFITVRDEKSQKLLENWGINSTLTSDPVYSLVQEEKINEDKKGLIVQLRSFNGINKEFISNLANSIVKNYQGEIKVFSFQNEIDEKICLDFIEELKKKGASAILIKDKNIKETIEIINSSKFVISTRLHGLIVSNALKSNTFALVYDEKIKTLVDELKIQNIDIKNYLKDELDNKLDAFFNHCLNENHPYREFNWKYLDSVLN